MKDGIFNIEEMRQHKDKRLGGVHYDVIKNNVVVGRVYVSFTEKTVKDSWANEPLLINREKLLKKTLDEWEYKPETKNLYYGIAKIVKIDKSLTYPLEAITAKFENGVEVRGINFYHIKYELNQEVIVHYSEDGYWFKIEITENDRLEPFYFYEDIIHYYVYKKQNPGPTWNQLS